jgi:hypothetical protein
MYSQEERESEELIINFVSCGRVLKGYGGRVAFISLLSLFPTLSVDLRYGQAPDDPFAGRPAMMHEQENANQANSEKWHRNPRESRVPPI